MTSIFDEGTPNLDGMDEEDLTAAEAALLALESREPNELREVRDLVRQYDEADLPLEEIHRAVGLLAEYAKLARSARVLRRAGRIGAALNVETVCERLYHALPKGMQW